ncbi:MAG: VWA domain-containing protein [Candidatus Berkelbacteria bacterium]|nr:VWA domain-containing protein [Candidatus Berkelbacteria bacterium]
MNGKDITHGKGIELTRTEKRITISSGGVDIRHEDKPTSGEVMGTGFVYLLVDCSGSMADSNKLAQAKKGAINFAKEALSKEYFIGLIQFESSATHICEPQREIAILEGHLKKIGAGGGTNMAEAIKIADQKLKDRKGSRVIVVITDGMPDSREATLAAAQEAKKNGIDIITIGTDDADEAFLKKLASRTELGVKVSREQFEKGIASTAKMLPQLGPGKKGK